VGGNIPNSKFNFDSFSASVMSHLNKSGLDKTVVDLNGLDAANADRVRNFIANLSAAQQSKIIIVR
jgi:CdiA C-terminal tRNase domain